MTLYELGKEYLKEADILSRLIKSYSVQCKKLNGTKLYEMNSKIAELREMENDMRLTGKNLTAYYDKSKNKHYVSHSSNPYLQL